MTRWIWANSLSSVAGSQKKDQTEAQSHSLMVQAIETAMKDPAGKPRIVGYAAKWAPGSFEYEHTPRRFEHPPEDEEFEVVRTTTRIVDPQFERPVSGADLIAFQRLVRRVPVADAVTRYAVAIEKHYGRPMDIEWAKDGADGRIYVLQARPETVKSRTRDVEERYALKGSSRSLVSGLRLRDDVEPEVVLQDLYLIDRIVRPQAGPREPEYRVPFLLEALEARDFFSDPHDRCEAIELFDGLCDLCDIRSYAGLASVLERFRHYRHARDPSAIGDR